MNGGLVPEMIDVCFYQIVDLDILNNSDTFVYLAGNVAPITGYEIYAGTVWNCLTLINSKEQMYPENITSVSHFCTCVSFWILEYLTQCVVSSKFSALHDLFLLSRASIYMW